MKRYGRWVLWHTEKDKFDLSKAKGLPDPPYEIETWHGFICISKTEGDKVTQWVIENLEDDLICRRILDSHRMPNGNWSHRVDFES